MGNIDFIASGVNNQLAEDFRDGVLASDAAFLRLDLWREWADLIPTLADQEGADRFGVIQEGVRALGELPTMGRLVAAVTMYALEQCWCEEFAADARASVLPEGEDSYAAGIAAFLHLAYDLTVGDDSRRWARGMALVHVVHAIKESPQIAGVLGGVRPELRDLADWAGAYFAGTALPAAEDHPTSSAFQLLRARIEGTVADPTVEPEPASGAVGWLRFALGGDRYRWRLRAFFRVALLVLSVAVGICGVLLIKDASDGCALAEEWIQDPGKAEEK